MSNFTKTRPVRAVLIHADGRAGDRWKNKGTNGRDEGNKGDLMFPPRIG